LLITSLTVLKSLVLEPAVASAWCASTASIRCAAAAAPLQKDSGSDDLLVGWRKYEVNSAMQ